MTALVPSHAPRMLASAEIGACSRPVKGIGQGLYRHDELRGDHQFLPSMHILGGEEGEPVAPAADVLDAPQPRNEGVWYAEKFQEFLPFVHCRYPHLRPRNGSLTACIPGSARRSVDRYTRPAPHGFAAVNGVAA